MTENSNSVELSDKLFITVTEGINKSGKLSHFFGMTVGKSRQVDISTEKVARIENVDLQTLRVVHHAPVTKRIEEALMQGKREIMDIFLTTDFIRTYSQAWTDGRNNLTATN